MTIRLLGFFIAEIYLPTLYVRLSGVGELWVERNPPYSDGRPFADTWVVDGARHWRLGRWQGIIEGVYDRERLVAC